jgi:hypothetical protein
MSQKKKKGKAPAPVVAPEVRTFAASRLRWAQNPADMNREHVQRWVLKPPNKKAARAGDTRAKSEADGTTQSFVACYSIVLACASERERMACVCLSKEEARRVA